MKICPATARARALPCGGFAYLICPATARARALPCGGFALSIELAADHVDRAEGRDQVGHHLALDHAVKGRHRRQAGGPAADAVGPVRAVGDDVEPELDR